MKLEFGNKEQIAILKMKTKNLSWAQRVGYYEPRHIYTCKQCRFLVWNDCQKTYYKCKLHPITSGPGTDIRLKNPACELFAQKWKSIIKKLVDRKDEIKKKNRLKNIVESEWSD